ncbi:MAG: MFS transporter [Candidatus Heimdallarchaeota archaeon]
MYEQSHHSEEICVSARFLLPSLITSYFVALTPGILTRLLLLDISNTFQQPVGIMGQITTVASLVTTISAVLMGAWSVRFNHKSLLLLGLVFCSISALGCFFALNFTMMLIAYAISGLGLGMVEPMVYTLVGAHFPLEKRVRGFGWLLTGAVLAAVSAPIMGVFASVEGWRLTFLGFILPITLLSFIMVVKGVPSHIQSLHHANYKEKYWEGFKEIFFNRSATSCLVGSVLAMIAWQAISLYSIAFFREYFHVSIKFASYIILGTAICYLLGCLTSSLFVNRFGMKLITVLTIFFAGIFIIAFMTVSHLGLALSFIFLSCFFFGMRASAASSLTLEQVPRFRGSMMSMNSAAWFLGFALGAGLGGITLLWFDYEFVGVVLGATGIMAAVVFYLLVNDPTST